MPFDFDICVVRAAATLQGMIREMLRKKLELKRITKTASLLIECGFLSPVLFGKISERCLAEQNPDGGWVANIDTAWNIRFLSLVNPRKFLSEIERGVGFLTENRSQSGLWGRSKRDFSRIPVSGMILSRIPSLVTADRLRLLEELWISERNSLTYKAAYTLMAFGASKYIPATKGLAEDTMSWLICNQRDDGSFAPWKSHPMSSDAYCTAVGILGLVDCGIPVEKSVLINAANWLKNTQLKSGIWPFHEIEDCSSWAMLALSKTDKLLKSVQ